MNESIGTFEPKTINSDRDFECLRMVASIGGNVCNAVVVRSRLYLRAKGPKTFRNFLQTKASGRNPSVPTNPAICIRTFSSKSLIRTRDTKVSVLRLLTTTEIGQWIFLHGKGRPSFRALLLLRFSSTTVNTQSRIKLDWKFRALTFLLQR